MTLNKVIFEVEKYATKLAKLGGIIILIQMLWISYGVFVRYALNSPDGTVTEATALLLFPLAFLGLAYTMKEDAYPKVTLLIDLLSEKIRIWIDVLNILIKVFTGLFLSYVAIDASINSFESGASSEILLWPRYVFWIFSALALVIFTIYAGLRLLKVINNNFVKI